MDKLNTDLTLSNILEIIGTDSDWLDIPDRLTAQGPLYLILVIKTRLPRVVPQSFTVKLYCFYDFNAFLWGERGRGDILGCIEAQKI